MIASLPFDALNKLFYDTLSGDSALTALADVYDEVPDDAAFPYVEIGQLELDLEQAHDGGFQVMHRITAWSGAPGMKELTDVLNAILAAAWPLREPADMEDGFTLDFALAKNVETGKEPHPITREVKRVGVIRFDCAITIGG